MGMRAFILRRLLLTIPIMLGAVLLVFAVTQLFDPYQRVALYVTDITKISEADMQSLIKQYGLEDPVYLQFFRWMRELLRGNLGASRVARQPVLEALITRFPATAEVVIFSAPLIIFVGIWLGIQSALHRDKIVDHITRATSIIGYSLPSFWLGILLISIFSVMLNLTPSPGRVSTSVIQYTQLQQRGYIPYTGLYTIDGILNGQLWITIDALQHLILPVTVLVSIQIALIVRIMRSSMLEALNKGYIVTARAKGLPQKEVINKHARRNALIPTVTLSGLLVAGMLNGVVITETIFGLNGVGQFAANAALNIDIAAVLGFTLFSGFIFIMANLLVDISYAYLDPRIRLE